MDRARIEIGRDGFRATIGIGKRHVAIRANEVYRIAAQSGSGDPRPPREYMECELALAAKRSQRRCAFTIHVHLPVERLERREVVAGRVRLHPRQPIAAVHVSRRARALRLLPR